MLQVRSAILPFCENLLLEKLSSILQSPNCKYLSKVVSSEIVMADPTWHTGEVSSASVQLEECVTRFPASILNNRERHGGRSWKSKDGYTAKTSWFRIDIKHDGLDEVSEMACLPILAFYTQRARADEDDEATEKEELYKMIPYCGSRACRILKR